MLLMVLAQAAVATPAAVDPQGDRQGVASYGREFFASYRPDTAYDMVRRLPGFSLDIGSGVRGYEGAAGNVLIDGKRPSTKADGLDEVLKRIPASAVERIDLIRGGAPGIDMQGKTVLANLIRKSGGGAHATTPRSSSGSRAATSPSTSKSKTLRGGASSAPWTISAARGKRRRWPSSKTAILTSAGFSSCDCARPSAADPRPDVRRRRPCLCVDAETYTCNSYEIAAIDNCAGVPSTRGAPARSFREIVHLTGI